MIGKLLLVTDGSEEATKADDLAIYLASLAKAEVVVMCNYQPPLGKMRRGAALFEEIRKGIEEEATEVLREVAARVQAAGLPVEAVAMEGSPADSVEQAIREYTPDIVVLGAGRTGGLPGLLWGSVAEIVRVSSVPVLVVK